MEENTKLEKCDCGKVATWLYMPGYSSGGNSFSCDECVPRGCSCNEYSTKPEDYHPPAGFNPSDEDGVEGVDWKWLNQEKTLWTHIDDKGRKWPCCEFENEPDGFDFSEYENDEN